MPPGTIVLVYLAVACWEDHGGADVISSTAQWGDRGCGITLPAHLRIFSTAREGLHYRAGFFQTGMCGAEGLNKKILLGYSEKPTAQRMPERAQLSRKHRKRARNAAVSSQCVYPKPGIGDFHLRENDYVFGSRKFGGNAQSVTKNRWIHRTSFLWDYEVRSVAYLKPPARAPEYRSARGHLEFICRMKDYMPRSIFIDKAVKATKTHFSLRSKGSEDIDSKHNILSLNQAIDNSKQPLLLLHLRVRSLSLVPCDKKC